MARDSSIHRCSRTHSIDSIPIIIGVMTTEQLQNRPWIAKAITGECGD
jgi:hypothetical protein